MSDQISKNADPTGRFYVVATPIGNLGDISARALQVLASVATVLAEDTRHSKRLFNHYGISTRLKACHEHNEEKLIDWVCEKLRQGQDLALISDAGTPLISDPGFVLVRALREQGCEVVAVPGASSIIAALSIAGLPTDRFLFDGFLPAKSSARRTQLQEYLSQSRTVVLLESSHRILASLLDMVEVLGEQRRVVLAREISKKFETVLDGTASELLQRLQQDSDQTRGEFVVLLAGVPELSNDQANTERMLRLLLTELPVKQAVGLVAKLTDARKNDIYQLALSLKDDPMRQA